MVSYFCLFLFGRGPYVEVPGQYVEVPGQYVEVPGQYVEVPGQYVEVPGYYAILTKTFTYFNLFLKKKLVDF
jgi:hypothetical protein